jgi:hypothetical protein
MLQEPDVVGSSPTGATLIHSLRRSSVAERRKPSDTPLR